MAVSKRKFLINRGSTKSLAAVSSIALALGAAAVIPGVYSEGNKTENARIQQAADSETAYTGGIRGADGTGAIEPAQQLASDIGSGSCTVNFSGQQGSKGGFSFNIQEPSRDSNNKRTFGANVKMDASQDRTWRDFLVLGSNNNAPVRTHSVAAAAPGDSILGEDITHSTESVMSIGRQGPRGPLTATIAADLSADDIAEAATETGVSYGWKDTYTQDNTSRPTQIFNDPDVQVSFNPWPSENDNCSAISVDWVPKEKLVIRPGEELKVGHINADSNSMSRMVAEAYDAQGKYIGSSNSSASGGEQKLRIDDNGDIIYTVPKYKGTKLSAQQGTRFNVMAQPRTVKQLRDAIPDGDFGQVYDESNALDRYNKPNVISGHQWSLDDTQFHDPLYEPAQQEIISGVDSENGPVATGPQSVTFTQSGDKIAELVKSRDEGGVEAEVKLDNRYVFNGWKAVMDPDSYEVTVTAPPNPAPGTFAQPRVIVTYTNGSQDIIPLLAVVDPNNTQVTELETPGLVQGPAGKPLKASLTTKAVMDGHDPVAPTSYKVDESTVPDGWKVKVDDDGNLVVVTATSDENTPNNSKITPTIIATYPDGTTDRVEATFQITNNVKVPDYTAVTGKANEEVTLEPVMPNIGLGGNADDEQPNRYTFPDGSLEYKTGDWTVTIDENTGELTSTIPDNALPGAQITVPVKSYYASGANPQIATGVINVIGDDTGDDIASYPPKYTKPGEPVKSDINTQLSDPSLGKYKLPKNLPANWTFSIDDNGSVTATPNSDVPAGASVQVDVEVTYPDGSTAKVPAKFAVVDSYSSANSPSYPTVTGKPGTSVTSTVNRTDIDDDAEPTFSIITDPNDPSYIAPPRNLNLQDVKIDPKTGEITTPIASNVLPGSHADIPVRVTYKDGSSNTTIATVVAVARQNQVYEPQYEQQTTTPGQPVDSLITDNTKVPNSDLIDDASQRYSVPAEVNGWKTSVDENGVVTATAPSDAKPGGGVDVPVTITYLDGSTDTVLASFKVKSQQKDTNEPVYAVESTKPGTKVTRDVNLNNAPSDTKFSFGNDGDQPIYHLEQDGWTYDIDFKTGEVSATPSSTAKPGDKKTIDVIANYPDGSTDKVPLTTVVNLTQNYEVDPAYPPETTYPGDEVTSPLNLNLPDGVKVAPKEKTPYRISPVDGMVPTGQTNAAGNPTYFYSTANGDWIVGLDDSGNVMATAPKTAKPGDAIGVPVIVTYEDGSQDTVTAPISIKDAPTREVPFEVEYKYDDTVPQGTYKVEKKGEPGAEVQNRAGEWSQTKAPVNEVVVIGTQPSKASDEMTWTMQTGFDTIMRPNPELAPGEVKVVQEGEAGERTISVKFDATLEQGGVPKVETTSDSQTKDPKPRIVEYGPGLDDQELTFTDKNRIPFETEIVYDPSLKAGEQVVDQKGEEGEEAVTTTQKLVNGKPSGDPVVTKEQTKAPVKQVIRVGGKTEGQTSNSVETEVPFGVKIEYDPTMPAGESQTVTEGKPGKKTITVTQKVSNSNPDGEPTVEEKVTEQPVDQVIKVGTKQATASDKVEWTEPIPFGTTLRPNPDLAPGETKVVQEGKNGEASYTATFTGTDGKAEVTESKDRTEPVERIVEYGPQAEDTSVVTKTEKPVPFETEIVFDDSLKAGDQVVDKQGENGTEVETSTQKIVDGKPSGEPTVTTERTKEPTNAVIRVGTKTEGTNTTESEVEVPFETEIQFDDSLPTGTQETVQEGKPGKDKVTTTQTIENSKVTGTTTETERVEEPVKKIIKVGTKGETTSKTVEWTESTPIEVEVRENPDLKAGETKVVQEGKPGEVKHTVTVTSDNGEISTKDDTEEISKPTKQIIEVGTAPSQTELSDKHTEQLPFETLIESDPNLEAGKIVEDQAGSFGEKEVTKVWKLKDGKVVGDPETTEDVTKEPTPRKLRVGTKVVTETQTETETEKVTETKEVPVELDRGFYGVELTKPGEPASQNIKDGSEGNTYEIGELPAGWTATVDENGTVTATPPADAKSGDYAEIPVTVTPEGGKPYTATATFIVKDDQPVDPTQPTETEVITAPTYNPAVIEAGGTQTVDINYGHADGNTYELGAVPAGWTVTIDETTGQLMVTPPADTPSGTIQEIPVTVTTEDGQTFNVKTVIGVISDNCGCEPVEPADPTDEPTDDPTEDPKDPTVDPKDPTEDPKDPTEDPKDPTDKPTTDPTEDPKDPTEDPKDPTDKPTTDPTEDPKDPTGEPTTDPTDEPTGKPTVDPSEGPSEDPKDPTEDPKDPTDKPTTDPTEDPTDEPNPGKPDEPQDPEPGKPNDPKDPEDPSGSSISDGLVPIIGGLIGGGILGSSVNDHHTPGGSPDAKPKVPTAPQPKLGEDEPKISGKVELNEQGQQTNGQTNQSNPSYGDAPRSNSTTSSQSGSKSTSGSTSSNRALADTGANVLGIVGVGIALIIGSTLLLRRERRND